MLEKALIAFDQEPEETIKEFNVEFYSPFSTYGLGFKAGAILSDRDRDWHYALHHDTNTGAYFAVSDVHLERKIQQVDIPKETCTQRNSKLFIASYEHNQESCIAYKLVKNSNDSEPVIFIIGHDVHE